MLVNTVSISCYVRQHGGNPNSQSEGLHYRRMDASVLERARERYWGGGGISLPEGISFHFPLLIKLPSVYTNVSHIIMTRLNPFTLTALLALFTKVKAHITMETHNRVRQEGRKQPDRTPTYEEHMGAISDGGVRT